MQVRAFERYIPLIDITQYILHILTKYVINLNFCENRLVVKHRKGGVNYKLSIDFWTRNITFQFS